MNTQTLLTQLRDPSDGGATDRLVSLWLDFVLDQPLSQWMEPSRAGKVTRETLLAWATAASSEVALADAVSVWSQHAQQDRRALSQVMPADVRQAASAVVGRPFVPDRALVLALLDRDSVRELVRGLLVDALLDFGRQLRTPVAGMAKGLTGLAKMAAETARSATGTLGALAGGVVGAVSGEVERQFEKRATEFVDSALSGVIRRLADQLSDPRNAAQQGALRVELVEGLLGLSPAQLAREVQRADVVGGAKLVRTALVRWLSDEKSAQQWQAAFEALVAPKATASTRSVLAELGVLEVFLKYGRDIGRAQLSAFFATQAFANFCAGLGSN